MTRHLVAFGAAFVLSALVAVVAAGCLPLGGCECPAMPALPERQEPIPGLAVMSFDASGNTAAPPVRPENGTAEVTGTEVVFVYTQAGIGHRVVYAVVAATP